MTSSIEEAQGIVVAIGAGRATVRIENGFACPRCAAGRGCGAVFLAADKSRLVEVDVPPRVALVVGQHVGLSLAPARLLEAAWIAYGIPLLALLGATLAAVTLSPASAGDATALVAAAAGLAAAGWWSRRRLRAAGCPARFLPSLDAGPGSGARAGR